MAVEVTVINPWWDGKWENRGWDDTRSSVGDANTDPPDVEDIDEVLYQGDTGDDWDGTAVFVAKLKDGRYMAYETSWGPTGDGFSEDAYGGDAEVWFAGPNDLNKLILTALTDHGRRLVGIPETGLES